MQQVFKRPDNSLVICFSRCADCPNVTMVHSNEYICIENSMIVKKPYARERVVDPTLIADDCPLLEKVQL